jgi:DNA-binding MarR family transcriptional regulator
MHQQTRYDLWHVTIWGERRVKRPLGEKVGEKLGEALTSNQRHILTLLCANPHTAAWEVAQHIGISSRKVEQNIAKLKALTLLKRIGPAKGGYWQVTEDQREGTEGALMQVVRQFIEVKQRQVVIELPASFINHRVEVIALTMDEDEPKLPKYRCPHPAIAGKGRTLGDLVSPVVKDIKP